MLGSSFKHTLCFPVSFGLFFFSFFFAGGGSSGMYVCIYLLHHASEGSCLYWSLLSDSCSGCPRAILPNPPPPTHTTYTPAFSQPNGSMSRVLWGNLFPCFPPDILVATGRQSLQQVWPLSLGFCGAPCFFLSLGAPRGFLEPRCAHGSQALVGSSRQLLDFRRLCTVIPYFIEWLFRQRTPCLPRIHLLKT